jgi:hypothetical protein
MPIRYETDDPRTDEEKAADDRAREEVERTGGVWAQMTPEQRTATLARLRDRKRRARAARGDKESREKALEERVAQLEKRVARLEGT